MDLPPEAHLELLYGETVGEAPRDLASAWAEDLARTLREVPGCRGLQVRLEHDGRRMLALIAWERASDREAFRTGPAAEAWAARWAPRGARTARSLWGTAQSEGGW